LAAILDVICLLIFPLSLFSSSFVIIWLINMCIYVWKNIGEFFSLVFILNRDFLVLEYIRLIFLFFSSLDLTRQFLGS
jgi:hypothetical protein